MRLIDRLSKAQRIVVVVALGMTSGANGASVPGTGLPAWLRLIVWLGLIGLWALASVRVLRPPRKEAEPD